MSALASYKSSVMRPFSGFSLVEMSVVIVVIGLLVGLTVTTGQMQVSTTKYQSTQSTLNNTKTALDLYYTKYKRYPCPALPADATGAATYGVEVAGGCSGACPAGLTCPASSKAVIGVLPYKTLNLSEEFAADDWGNKLNYTVDKDFTAANTTAIYGTIPILDKNGNEITRSADGGKAIYTLLSSGVNGNGAWRKAGGSRAACDTARKDGNNCSGAANFTDNTLNNSTAAASANSFDNLLTWKVRESTAHIVIAPPVSTVAVTPTPSVTSTNTLVVSGGGVTCILAADNSIKCTGEDFDEGLGNGASGNTVIFGQEARGFTDWSSISGNNSGSCGLRSNGTAYCWGLGVSTATEVTGSFTDWTNITRGYYHQCGVRNGHAYCWGNGSNGQLGDGSYGSYSIVEVSDVPGTGHYTDWTLLMGGDYHTCGLRGTGIAYCWGENGSGELGNGSTTSTTIPVAVSGGFTDWKTLTSSGEGSCGIRATGQAYCWGKNPHGNLGNGTGSDSNIPVEVSGGYTDWTDIFYGYEVSCGVRGVGIAYCWGNNSYGALGTGAASSDKLTPQLVSGGFTDWKYVRTDDEHTCGVRASGALYCWGENYIGQFGNGTSTGAIIYGPILIPGVSGKVN